ncbi:hypothetical protein AYO38_08410 [bacterium SCGC AG-212-C10]|nr:hypothetical protein AYO38_08410 [bacterium SCGC AG-212-C10]
MLDAGPLIALDRREPNAWSFVEIAARRKTDVIVPAPVLAQVWRGSRSAPLAIALRGINVLSMDEAVAKRAGELCAASETRDIVDATVVAMAIARGFDILTADLDDIRKLVSASARRVRVIVL